MAKKAFETMFSEGPATLLKKTYNFSRRKWVQGPHPFKRRYTVSQKLLNKNGYNLCYNRQIPENYDSEKRNILLAIESPGVVKHEEWLDTHMDFYAEISFANFYDLENYYCPRTLYAGNDNFVELEPEREFNSKEKLVSFIYSESDHLPGHELRHVIADRFGERIDVYGSGEGNLTREYWSEVHQTYLEDKTTSLENHMFQIVVENAKYPEYVSEKFYDSLKTKTVPIYWGGERALNKMGFDLNGVLLFDDLDELASILDRLSAELYEEMLPAIEYNRERLIELRRESKFEFYLSSVSQGYLHSMQSYHKKQYDSLGLELD